MAAFDAAADLLMSEIEAGTDVRLATLAVDDERDLPTRLDQFDRALALYLDTLAEHPATARLFLVEVYAAGPEAVRRRMAVQRQIVDAVVTILGVAPDDADGRFSCEVLVAAVSTMVAEPLVSDDPTTLRDLHDPLMALVRRTADGADERR